MATERKISDAQHVYNDSHTAKYFAKPENDYPVGLTRITDFEKDDTTLAVSFLRLQAGEEFSFETTNETAFLLAHGKVTIITDDETVSLTRTNPFEEDPSCVHLPKGQKISFAVGNNETVFTVYEAPNEQPFPVKIYKPEDTVAVWFDDQAKPIAKPTGTATDRRVRTLFDNSNADPALHTHENATLTVGEVLSLPACWSSWRPHNHQEPTDKIARGYIEESYFYFTDAFGLSQMGEGQWQEIWNHDLVLHRGNNHSQASSPDGAVCYAWVIHTPHGHKWERYLDPVYQPKGKGKAS